MYLLISQIWKGLARETMNTPGLMMSGSQNYLWVSYAEEVSNT